jgi:lysophospholipase L1-like esterase
VLRLPLHHGRVDQWVERAGIDPAVPRVRFRTDGRGYIRPVDQHAMPDATIAFLGGSTTECRAVQEELRFPALVSTLLAQRGIRANVLNAGRSASTVHDALQVLLARVADDHPDLAVLMEVTNDAGVLARDWTYRGRAGSPVRARDLAKWSLQVLSHRLALADLVRLRLVPALQPERTGVWDPSKLRRPAPREPYRARIEAFAGVARAFAIEPVLMTQPLGYVDATTPAWVEVSEQRAFNDEVRGASRRLDVALVDLADRIERQPDAARPGALFYDGIHVTDRGSRAYAEAIAEALEPLLASRRARAAQ